MKAEQFLSIIAMFAIGTSFGIWQKDVHAGIFAGLSTYYIFMFRYNL